MSCALEHPHLSRVIGIVPGPSCQPPSEQPLLVCGRGFVRWRVCVCGCGFVRAYALKSVWVCGRGLVRAYALESV